MSTLSESSVGNPFSHAVIQAVLTLMVHPIQPVGLVSLISQIAGTGIALFDKTFRRSSGGVCCHSTDGGIYRRH